MLAHGIRREGSPWESPAVRRFLAGLDCLRSHTKGDRGPARTRRTLDCELASLLLWRASEFLEEFQKVDRPAGTGDKIGFPVL
jgi:hypothetical protein